MAIVCDDGRPCPILSYGGQLNHCRPYDCAMVCEGEGYHGGSVPICALSALVEGIDEYDRGMFLDELRSRIMAFMDEREAILNDIRQDGYGEGPERRERVDYLRRSSDLCGTYLSGAGNRARRFL